MEANETILPVLRPDLRVLPGPTASDGSPSIVIYDPLSRAYHGFTWIETLILELLFRPASLDDVMDALQKRDIIHVSQDSCASLQYAGACGFDRKDAFRTPESLDAERRTRKTGAMKWLLHHYLYFRIPLLRPDGFLERMLPYVRFLASPWLFSFTSYWGFWDWAQWLSDMKHFFIPSSISLTGRGWHFMHSP